MCGILAWVGRPLDRDLLGRATDRMVHRGPDAAGHWTDGEAFLGHRRLKIIDLTETGAQPMANEDGTVLVTFNGEIYDYTELRDELAAKGHVFRSRSDTETIVHAYEEWGDACVERLHGMFAFAIWDQKRRRLFAARDRFGKKPLCYVHAGERLALASEIPALLATGLPARRIDQEALAFFWLLDYVPAPWTAFADIRKLPAGHALAFEQGRLRTWRYYPPRAVPRFVGSYDEAKEQLRALLADATRRRLVSEVPVGVALSGGIDSACVLAAAREATRERLVTVTVRPHLENHEQDEGDFARATARQFGTEHVEIRPEPEFRESYEGIVKNLGEPFAIASAIPGYYLFKTLRRHATVVITGDGGDEMFAGYDHYRDVARQARVRALLRPGLLRAARAAAGALYALAPVLKDRLKAVHAGLQVLAGEPWTFPASVYRRLLRGGAAERWLDARRVHTLHRELEGLFDDRDPVQRQMLREQFERMSYHILTKVDTTSMAHSVEVRSPLLDHRVAEFARSLPLEWLIRGGTGKWILRDAYAERLPAAVRTKPKTGFGLPLRELLGTSLRGYVEERVASGGGVYGEIVDGVAARGLVAAHARGNPYCTRILLQLLALRYWLDATGAR